MFISHAETLTMENPSQSLSVDDRLQLYARTNHCLLITGERGTGKTTTARQVHQACSRRSKHQFVNVNCASLSENLLESELFGYERGAFTGAATARAGLFEVAAGGTIFLDEIAELPLSLQAKLLKAVEEKRIRRVGSNIERPVEVRIIAATSRSLEQMVRDGSFRADLFDRLNILRLTVPPLRAKPSQIMPLLVTLLTQERSSLSLSSDFSFSSDACDLLMNYKWPGNFREARNFAVRLAIELGETPLITASDVTPFVAASELPGSVSARRQNNPNDTTVTVTFNTAEDDLDAIYLKAAATVIRKVLDDNGNSFRQAARSMGATHSTLSRIMQKYEAKSGWDEPFLN